MCHEETGLKTGIRLSRNGQVECISKNGKDCVWGELGNKICQKLKTCRKTRRTIKRLSCGNDFKRIWGHNGYRFPTGHWCKKGFAFFFYTGHWLCKPRTGLSTPVRLAINGDIECISKNGKSCIWGVEGLDRCKSIIRRYGGRTRRRLRCGRRHKRIYKFSGYRKRSHWCRKSHDMIFDKQISLIYTFNTSTSTPERHHPRFRRHSRNTNRRRHHRRRRFRRHTRNTIRRVTIRSATRRRFRRLHGRNWRKVLRRKHGKWWKLRAKYGSRWKIKLRAKHGWNWRVKLSRRRRGRGR